VIGTTAAAVLVLAVVTVGSCAYYNTLYNAKQRYREANKLHRGRDGTVTRQQRAAYEDVITKCQSVIGTWPNSRHVDDAMLLIANSLYQQDLFGACVTQIDTLEAHFPHSNLLRQARLLKGRALSQWGEDKEAIAVLLDYRKRWPKKHGNDEALFYLAASAINLGHDEEALGYVHTLQTEYSGSAYTFRAQLRVASTLADKHHWKEAGEVYDRLNKARLPIAYRYPVWSGLAEAYLQSGSPRDALDIVRQLQALDLTIQQQPVVLLLRGAAYEKIDSVQVAINTYLEVAKRFARGEYGAEAHFRLGSIFEEADSLVKAKRQYEQVGRSYARSEHAIESVRRAGSIGKLLQLASAADTHSPEARALRAFTLAEIQFAQFENAQRAVAGYESVVDSFPDTKLAPKAAYALTYLYSVVLHDSLRAAGAYKLLTTRYPDTQQARYAGLLLFGRSAPAPFVKPPPVAGVPDSVRADTTSGSTRRGPG